MTSLCQQLDLPTEDLANCNSCRHAIPLSNDHYCTKLKKRIKNITNCPYFEPEPIEYKFYVRM